MPVREFLRKALPQALGTSSLITALALKAEAVLGYSGLRKRLGIEMGSLACTLGELGIEPFRFADVEIYKMEKAREVEKHLTSVPAGTSVRAEWRTVSLNGYKGEVPEFALSHALEIKERMPAAKFEVEELRVEKQYDPFLIVSCGKERFYIDVWEEEEFEKKQR
jgi:hypothetical protein